MHALKQLFSRKRWRWIHRLTRVHRVHHPRWSYGWSAPFGRNVFFERYGWKPVSRDSYHDCTVTGRY
jgi:hypothetical protein